MKIKCPSCWTKNTETSYNCYECWEVFWENKKQYKEFLKTKHKAPKPIKISMPINISWKLSKDSVIRKPFFIVVSAFILISAILITPVYYDIWVWWVIWTVLCYLIFAFLLWFIPVLIRRKKVKNAGLKIYWWISIALCIMTIFGTYPIVSEVFWAIVLLDIDTLIKIFGG